MIPTEVTVYVADGSTTVTADRLRTERGEFHTAVVASEDAVVTFAGTRAQLRRLAVQFMAALGNGAGR